MPPVIDPETGQVNLFDPEFAREPQPVYARMREGHRVARSAFLGTPILSRHDDVMAALRQPEVFSSAMEMQLALGTERPMIPQQVDPPAQTRYRKLLDPHFSRRKMEALVPAIREHANALIDRFEADGECEFDAAFAIPLPCTAFLSLLGLPHGDLDLFLALKDGIIRPQKSMEGVIDVERLKAARVTSGRQIYRYFEEVIADREAHPRDDLMTALVKSEMDGERLTHEEILDICFLLLLAGLDTVTATLGCNMAYLAANPAQCREIVEDPALIPSAVEELLRWETPVTGVPRVLTQDVEIGGLVLEAGQVVTLLLGAANTDEARFSDPERVDFGRERNIHAAFGAGPHRCLGSHLARMELQVAMEEWHRRLPDYRVKTGETPTYSPGIREVLYLPLTWVP